MMSNEEYLANLKKLNSILINEGQQQEILASMYNDSVNGQERLFRALRNVRMPGELPDEFYELEEKVLGKQKEDKGIVKAEEIETVSEDSPLALWQGDITKLEVDAIVNAANSELLGCFIPEHNCIDNVIHSAAGVELRDECETIMKEQNHPEENGKAKITDGYNLPAKHVIHTVGPVVKEFVTSENKEDLKNCYLSILELADENNLESIALCCISTGVFHFPNDKAAQIAVDTVKNYLKAHPDTSLKKVIFNVFLDKDKAIYEELLKE